MLIAAAALFAAIVAGACWLADLVEAAQRESRQHETDEHADWLGADAGGSFHRESE